MLKYNIARLFKVKGISKPIPYLIKAGFKRNAASRLLNKGEITLKVKQIETICLALKCTPNDLFEWIPDKPELINGNNPLCKLIGDSSGIIDLRKIAEELPFNKLPEFAKKVDEIKKSLLSV